MRHGAVTGSPVTVDLLGPFEIRAENAVRRLHSAKASALLAFLAHRMGQEHGRDRLAGLLWPDAEPERARQSLRQAVYSIKQGLRGADEALRQTPDSVALVSHPSLAVDWWTLVAVADRERVPTPELVRVAAICRGPWLDGLSGSWSDEFDQWLSRTRELAREHQTALLDSAATRLLLEMRLSDARALVRRSIDLDPQREAAYGLLMKIAAEAGDLAAIHSSFAQLERVLRDGLATAPSPEIIRLRTRLVARLSSAPSSAAPAAATVGLGPHRQLVGRSAERAAVARFINDGSARPQSGVMGISGASGIGKTRLLEEASRIAEAIGIRVVWIAGRQSEARAAYSACADLLDQLGDSDRRAWLRGASESVLRDLSLLVPAISELPQHDGDAAGAQVRLAGAINHTLNHLSSEEPLLLVVDDAHWIDPASLSLLLRVLRHHRVGSLLLLLAGRREGHWRHDLESESESEIIDLMPLSTDAVEGALIEAGVGRSDPQLRRLSSAVEGNALMLVEVARLLSRLPAGAPLPNDFGTGDIPERVRALVRTRLVTLSDGARQVLEAAAILDGSAELRLIARMTRLPLPTLAKGLRELEESDWLACRSADAPPEISQEFIRRSVYLELRSHVRVELHRRAAAIYATEARHSNPGAAAAVARHLRLGGDGRALEWTLRAAQVASRFDVLREADSLLCEAIALGKGMSGDDLARVLLERADLAERRGDRPAARAIVSDLLIAVARSGDAKLRASSLLRQASVLVHDGDRSAADSVGREALLILRVAGDRESEAAACRDLGFLHWRDGDPARALGYARTALELHRVAGNLGAEATALINLAEIYRTLGSPEKAVELAQESAALQWSLRDEAGRGLALYASASAHHQRGAFELAERQWVEAQACFMTAQRPLMASRAAHSRATLAYQRNDFGLAREHFAKALALSRATGFAPGIAYGLLGQIQLDMMSGLPAPEGALNEAEFWMSLCGDANGMASLRQLKAGQALDGLATGLTAFRGHVVAPEGKVFCVFESPVVSNAASESRG